MNRIRIAIADDHELFREGIEMLLRSVKDFKVLVSVHDGSGLLESLATTEVDIVLLDLDMPGMSGSETLVRLNKNPNPQKVIILSMHNEQRMVSQMISKGARSYLPKNVNRDELELAIRKVFEEGHYYNQLMTDALIGEARFKTDSSNLYLPLSPREEQVLEKICKEYTNKEIAEALCLSEKTVEGHRIHLLEKLKVKNTAGLVKKAIALNLVSL